MQTVHLLKKAFTYHQNGDLKRAEPLYREILNAAPDHPEALHLLGFLGYQTGRNDMAADLIKAAIRISPQNPDYHNDLGQVLHDLGQLDEAVGCYRQAIAINPGFSAAHNYLGNAYLDLGRIAPAIESYREAIRLAPRYAEACNNLGIALQKADQTDQAIDAYRQAVDIAPDYYEAYHNLGNLLHDRGKLDQALDCYRKMIAIAPARTNAYSNMGNIFLDRGQFDQAISHYRKAIEINPQHVLSHNNLGNALQEQGQLDQAIASYRTAVELRPEFAMAYNNMGVALQDQGREKEAINCYRRALEIEPHYAQACSHLVHQLQRTCSWQPLKSLADQLDAFNQQALAADQKTPEQPFQNISRHLDPELNGAVAASWAAGVARLVSPASGRFEFQVPTPPKPQLSIGYLSGNFRNHPMAHLLLGLFRCHSRKDFKINCYSFGENDGSAYRKRIEQNCDKFVDIRDLNYRDAAKAIYADGIDILVDLVGHTKGNRVAICALRPAPVQVRYLGLAGTTGAAFYDYIISDRIVTPAAHQAFYSESFVYMPHCYQINDNRATTEATDWTRADFNLPATGFVFCAFHQGYKIEPMIFDTWMNILKQVPNSVLWLQENGELADKNLQNEARMRGVDPDRLVFARRLNKDEHRARLKLADLALDTRIVTGAATTSDALWMGVPVVTAAGSHFASNMSASILTAIGLPELVGPDLDAYEHLAVSLAQNAEELAATRRKLRDNRNRQPLFDTQGFAGHLERAYQKMYRVYAQGEKPSSIKLTAEAQVINSPVPISDLGTGAEQGLKKIAVFCGSNDRFIGDIAAHIAQDHEVQQFKGTTVAEMQALMEWSDIAWFEWCDGMVVQASKLPKVCKIICRLHSYEVFANFPHEVEWPKIDCLVFVAEHIQTIFLDQLPHLKQQLPMQVIHNGIDLHQYKLLEKPKGFNIAYVGYINHKKSPSLLLQCMSHLKEIDPRYILHIAGEHQELRFKLYVEHMVNALGLQKNVVFHGWVENVEAWLGDKSFILSTSVLESFGYGIAEAMARGLKPIIHNFVGAGHLYPQEYLFNNVREFGQMVLSAEFRPAEYRQYIADNYSQGKQFDGIDRLIAKM